MTSEEEEAMIERRVAMEGRFVRIESKLDMLVTSTNDDKIIRSQVAEQLDKTTKENDKRFTKIEHKLIWASGIITTVVVAANWFFKS